jgi:hypothetical protein
MGCDETRTPYGVAPEPEQKNQAEGQISLESSTLIFQNLKNKSSMTHVPQPPGLESKSQSFGKKDPMGRGMDCVKN